MSATNLPLFDADMMKSGRAVISLKQRFEKIARSWPTLSAEGRRQYELAHMAPELNETTGQFVYALQPDHFILSLMGMRRWLHACYEVEQQNALIEVDPWLVAGGLRKQSWISMLPSTFLDFADALDRATFDKDSSVGSFTHWLKPFPLLWAGEGKNRVESYQETERQLLTNVEVCRFLPSQSLRLYKSAINDTVWLVRYVGELSSEWTSRMDRYGEPSTPMQVLPFPDLAVPLLQRYGVKIDRGWGWPWRISRAAQLRESRLVRSVGWS